MRLTKEQIEAIHGRVSWPCRSVEIRPWTTTGNYVEVSLFDRARLIETIKVAPGGVVKVLS